MKKDAFKSAGKWLETTTKKHAPEILTGIGAAGMIITVILAVKATPKAMTLITDKSVEEHRKLTKVEAVKTAWQCYIPTVIVGTASTACIIGAGSENLRRRTALAAAYTLSENALKEYSEKVVEVIGEKKEQSVRDAVAKDKLERVEKTDCEVLTTGHGNVLCLDALSGRLFLSDADFLRKCANEINRRMRSEMYISLNEFYNEIGLDSIDLGERIGWNIDRGYVDLRFSSQLTKDDVPCLVLGFQVPPIYEVF